MLLPDLIFDASSDTPGAQMTPLLPFLRASLAAILWLTAAGNGCLGAAVAASSTSPLEQAEARLKRIEEALGDQATRLLSEAQLKAYLAQLNEIRAQGAACEGEATPLLERLQGELVILSPEKPADKGTEKGDVAAEQPKPAAAPGAGKEIEQRRRELEQERERLNARLAACRLLVFKSQDLTNRVTALQQGLLADRLKTLGPNLLEVLGTSLSEAGRWWAATRELIWVDSGVGRLGWQHAAGIGAVALVGVGLGTLARRGLRRRAAARPPVRDMGGAALLAALACGARFAPLLGGMLGAALYLTGLQRLAFEVPFLTGLAYGLLTFFAVMAVMRMVLHPCPPARHYLELPADVSTALAQRLWALGALTLTGLLLFQTPLQEHLPEWLELLAQDVFVAIYVLNLIWILWLVGRFERWRRDWKLRVLITLAAAGALGAEWAGYRVFSQFLIIGVTLTLLLTGLGLALTRLLGDLFDGLDEGRHGWQRRARGWVGVLPGEHVPGAGWLHMLTVLLLWLGVGAALLRIWGVSAQGFALIGLHFTEGFPIGGIKVVPAKILLAILLLALLLTLTRWIKGQLNRRWLNKFRLDRGVRDALVTTSGYLGATAAVLLALSVAGIELTNLAIVAGALSVGIGFGLQNIVNNFVSGLILLFERPVKTGDYIVVGGTQGYVKRISIRSTQIETPDRADVILPNSALISGQVTNWMLHDPMGRITVPVGVAQGSDPQRVREILLGVAAEHPEVIKGRPGVSDPKVLFRAFGENAYLFELRAVVRQIDRQGDVISDINFAVEAAFRAQGIEFPCPPSERASRPAPARTIPG